MAVRSKARSLDAAIESARSAASGVALLVSFCVNAVVEPPAVHVAFNSTDGLSRREFIEVFLPDERGLPRIGRWIDVPSLFAFGQAAYTCSEAPRLFRAMGQYQAALRYWTTGSQILALAHLYIACEVLTKAVQRFHQSRLGLTETEHAQLLGVDIGEKNWQMMAGNFARREYIFEDDRKIYDAARRASNEFEHGNADLGNVRETAESVTRELFDLVRSAMLTLLPSLDQTIADAIMAKYPVDVSPLYKQVTGYIVSSEPSDPLNLGVEGQLFPILNWNSRIKASRLEDDRLVFEPEDIFTVQFAPGLQFEARDIAVYGGMNPAPANTGARRPSGWAQGSWIARENIAAIPGVEQKRDLFAAVTPLVNAATGTGTYVELGFLRAHAFNLFSQGVAYFQSIQALIARDQPVEALLLLRGLVDIAARFEQIAEEDGGLGLGLIVRLAIDVPEAGPAERNADRSAAIREMFMRSAAELGLVVPEQAGQPEATMTWRSLGAEMELADRAVKGGFGIVGLHLKPGDEPNSVGFHVQLAAGPFTDLVASASVIAQLDLLKHAAPVFEWAVDSDRIEALLVEAREVNETSARRLAAS